MATTSKPLAGVPHALSEEVRSAGMDGVAAKLEVHHAIRARLADEHRPLTPDEVKAQRDHALTLEEMQAAQQVEYGTYVAAEDIFHGSGLAYREGQAVPVSNVEQHGYDRDGLVRRVAPPAKSAPKDGA